MKNYIIKISIHQWAPNSTLISIDTIFRAPVMADEEHTMKAIVTDIDEEAQIVELDLTLANEKNETRVLGTARIKIAS